MNFLTLTGSSSHTKYSIERLRCLYGDLLNAIDHENHDILLESRHREAETSPRFGLRRKVFWLKTQQLENDVDEKTEQQRRNVSSAFWAMAATRSIASVPLWRDEASVAALEVAQSLEMSVVTLIRSIGEVVVNAEGRQPTNDATKKDLRSDPAFEYFCEKAILALFVEIACETPHKGDSHSTFHGVVWSPRVKAQVFHTVSLLVAGVRDSSALYYLLSQNCMNKLVAGMLPLHQWTDPALEIMLPPYVEMIKTLALQLGDAPHLFPLFTVPPQDEKESRVHFPLFSATLLTGTSSFAESNSFVHATCLNLIVELLQIPYPPIQEYLQGAVEEHEALAEHLCALLLRRYTRMVQLTTGPVVDGIRSSALEAQIKGLNDQLELLNDVLQCPLRGLQVRLCEKLLQKLVIVLWKSCGSERPLLSSKSIIPSVGVPDTDVIPASEAAAQVAYVVLTQFLVKMRYAPALRMLGVALWHERSSPLWKNEVCDTEYQSDSVYTYTKALHSVVSTQSEDWTNNLFRTEYYRTLRGDYGEWRVVTAATLMYQCLRVLDTETLRLLEIIPFSSQVSPLEQAVADFFQLKHTRNSNVSCVALECMASLAMEWVQCVVQSTTRDTVSLDRVRTSPLLRGLQTARDFFFRSTNDSEEIVGVSDLFVDIVESVVLSFYRKITLRVNGARSGPRILGYNLCRVGCSQALNNSEVLVRKTRSVKSNEVELTRFHATMALHLRAVLRVTVRFLEEVSQSQPDNAKNVQLDTIDRADELRSVFGGLREKPMPGTDIDIRGRVSFPFFIDTTINTPKVSAMQSRNRERTLSDDMILRSGTTLVVVLDPTDLYIVKTLAKHDFKQGTVICCIPLLNVIAAATDNDWLHIAVRHEDVGLLIKNGNMALRFDTPGTGLIVRQYIDRSRTVLRGELVRKIKHLLDDDGNDGDKNKAAAEDDDDGDAEEGDGRAASVEETRVNSNADKRTRQETTNSQKGDEVFAIREDKKEVDHVDRKGQ